MELLNLIKKKNDKIKSLLNDLEKNKEFAIKLEIFNKILKINNTDKDIITKYLLFLKENNIVYENNDELKIFFNFIPKENFSKYFGIKISAIEKLILFFDKILSENWKLAKYDIRKETIFFFYNCFNENKKEINNSSPITWSNKELYIYNLFKEFLDAINRKMDYYATFNNINSEKMEKSNNFINKMNEKLNDNNTSSEMREEIIKLLDKAKSNRRIISIIEGNFYKEYLFKFNEFLSSIKNTFLRDLKEYKFEKNEEKQLFEYFMLYITNCDFENLSFEAMNVWKNSFINLTYAEKNKIVEQINNFESDDLKLILKNDDVLIVNYINNKTKIEIENINDYDFKSLCKSLALGTDNHKYSFIKYIKIPKINNHLYIKKIYDNWIKFNIMIYKTQVITTLFSTLFEKQNFFILDENELRIIFENINFFIFQTDFKGYTMRKALKIYAYGAIIDFGNEDLSKLIFCSFSMIINEHEILGHLNIGYQRYDKNNTDDNSKINTYDSPVEENQYSNDYAKERNGKESGENLEIKLYGRVITSITIKEAFFILNHKNYNMDYSQFKEKFMEINDKELMIDESLKKYLLVNFGINVDNIPLNNNEVFQIDKFIKKNYGKTYYIGRRHPLNFDIDGNYLKKYQDINKILEILKNLD